MSTQQIGRLAMRVEGDNWVACYAEPGTMEGAVWLGAIRMTLVADLDRKNAFMEIMKSAISEFIEAQTGAELLWPEPQRAPESERSGRA
jgi:hypothetical protein